MKELLNEWKKFLNEGYAFVDPDGDRRELPDEIIKVYLDALGKHNLGVYHDEHSADNPDYYPPRNGAFYIVADYVIKDLEKSGKIDYSKYGEGTDLAAVLQKYAKEDQLHLKYDMGGGGDEY
mgnify:FL=1|jgi:hypothetical protein